MSHSVCSINRVLAVAGRKGMRIACVMATFWICNEESRGSSIPDVTTISSGIESSASAPDTWFSYNPGGVWSGESSPGYGYLWNQYRQAAIFSWGGSVLGQGSTWYGIIFQPAGGMSRVAQISPTVTDARSALCFKPSVSGRYSIAPNPGYKTIDLAAQGDIPAADQNKTAKFAIYKNETMLWPANGLPLQLSKHTPSAAFPTLEVNLSASDTLRFVVENADQSGLYGYNASMRLYPVITSVDLTSAYSIPQANAPSALIESNATADQWFSYTQTAPWIAEYFDNTVWWQKYSQAAVFSWGASILGSGQTWYGMVFQAYKGVDRVPNPTPSASTMKMALSYIPAQSGTYSIGPSANYTTIDLINAAHIEASDESKTAKFAIYKNDTIIWPANGNPLALSKSGPVQQFPSLEVVLDTTDIIRFVVDCTDQTGLTGWYAAMAFFPEVKCVGTNNFTKNTITTWFENSLTDIFHDTVQSTTSMSSGTIHMARNETESIQIALRCDTQTLNNVTTSVGGLSGSNSPVVTVKPVRQLYNSKSSYGILGEYNRNAGYARRLSPGYFPSYYENTGSIGTITSWRTQGFLVEVTASRNTAPGTYNAWVNINTELGVTTVPFTIVVYSATLPDPKDSTLAYNAYFHSATHPGAAHYSEGYHVGNVLNSFYNCANYNANFWQLMRNYAAVLKKQRQNTIKVPVEALILPDMTINGDGSYAIDWTKFDQFINTFISHGSVKYLDSNYPYEKDWYIKQDPYGGLVAWVFQNDTDGKVRSVWKLVDSDSSVVNSHIDKLYNALYSHLQTKGWINMWLQHSADEPLSQIQYGQITALYNRLKGINSAIKTIAPGSDQNIHFGAELDIPVPQIDSYENNKVSFDAINNSNGRQTWTYTCVNPQGNWLTRLGDYPLQSTRMLGWYLWKNNLKGFLHWSWNSWYQAANGTNNPFIDIYCPDGVEDAWLVYPDSANLSVMEGPRSTAMRDALEDYEILQLANSYNSGRTGQIVSQMVLSGQQFNRNPGELISNRLEVLKLASRINTPPVFTSHTLSGTTSAPATVYSATIAGSATDADDNPLTYEKLSGPAWLNIASDGTLTGTPQAGDGGVNVWMVRVKDGFGGSDIARLVIQVIVYPANNYGELQGNSTSSGYINRIQLADLDKTSGNNNGYADFRNLVATLTPGQSVNYTFTPGGNFSTVRWTVWIDFNRDGDFGDSGEMIVGPTDGSSSAVSGNFTVPSGASVGPSRMRIAMRRSVFGTGQSDPTGSFSNGEVEDYSVQIGTNPTPNAAPYFLSDPIAKAGVTAGSPMSGSLAADAGDWEGDPLTYSKTSGPAWLTVASNGAVSGTPPTSAQGTNNFVVSVADGSGGTDSTTLQINVVAAPFELWKQENFTPQQLAQSGVVGYLDDPDRDGVANLLEYALGMDPNQASSSGLPVGAVTGDYLSLSFNRQIYADDITYRVEAVENLNSSWVEIWNSFNVHYGGGSNPSQQVTVQDTVPVSDSPKRFMRLKVTKP